MTADQEKPGEANPEVGYCRPPKWSRFRKGRSGNPRGRPGRVEPAGVDIAALLREPIAVTKGGVARAMSPFEAGLRSLVKRALMGRDLKAARAFLKICEGYEVMVPPRTPPLTGRLIVIPKSWDRDEWMEMFHRLGPPPWPGKRSGLPGDPPKES
jgi:Family of unknown function (DUF5681)